MVPLSLHASQLLTVELSLKLLFNQIDLPLIQLWLLLVDFITVFYELLFYRELNIRHHMLPTKQNVNFRKLNVRFYVVQQSKSGVV